MARKKSRLDIALRNYYRDLKITGASELMRRYFVMNSFDGALTTIGLLMGAMVGGVQEPHAVIVLSVSTAIALAISGSWGSYLTETAERKKDLQDLESTLLHKLEGSDIHRAGKTAVYSVALVNGAAPLIASLLIISPVVASNLGLLPVQDAFAYSFAIAGLLLFVLGAYLGKISNRSLAANGIKMLLAGLFAAAVSFFLLG